MDSSNCRGHFLHGFYACSLLNVKLATLVFVGEGEGYISMQKNKFPVVVNSRIRMNE